jgi:UPF0176 protein
MTTSAENSTNKASATGTFATAPAPTDPLNALTHSAFYKFVLIEDVDRAVDDLRAMTEHVLGSIIVATEGINGMVAGSAAEVDRFERALTADARFGHVVFKRSPCRTAPFKRMKVYRKPEIVPLGIAGVDGRNTQTDVPPAEWRELIQRDDVVLLDNRNSFEYRLGRFHNAIDPGVTNFRDFPNYVKAHVDEWKAAGKSVAMYCTGGIRCEKTSAWMREFDIPVYQLEGGILNFFQSMPDAEKDWDGECFVFDNRVALDTKLQETDTTVDDVYKDEPDGEWRLNRAKELEQGS